MDPWGGLVTHDKLATRMAVMTLAPNFFPFFLLFSLTIKMLTLQECVGTPSCAWCYVLFSRASVPSHSREPGQSWEQALTGSLFQLIWLANLIST